MKTITYPAGPMVLDEDSHPHKIAILNNRPYWVDEGMVLLLELLNDAGYKTRYSCQNAGGLAYVMLNGINTATNLRIAAGGVFEMNDGFDKYSSEINIVVRNNASILRFDPGGIWSLINWLRGSND